MWTGDRSNTLPPDWHKRRGAVKARARGICEHPGCAAPGTDCHHAGHREDHSLESLMWLCAEHHKAITQQQAKAARRAQLDKLRHPMSRRQ